MTHHRTQILGMYSICYLSFLANTGNPALGDTGGGETSCH